MNSPLKRSLSSSNQTASKMQCDSMPNVSPLCAMFITYPPTVLAGLFVRMSLLGTSVSTTYVYIDIDENGYAYTSSNDSAGLEGGKQCAVSMVMIQDLEAVPNYTGIHA